MPSDNRDELLEYYQRELLYLRNQGAAFAARYPKVAARLDFSATESPDPHTERLLESFAFLTARIQRTLDAEFPEIPTALLTVLHPHLMAPVPSLAIARFEVDPDQARAVTGFTIPDNTPLYAEGPGGLTCRFRTGYPVALWPIEVAAAEMAAPAVFGFLDHRTDVAAVLRLRLKCLGALTFADVAPQRLRFHISADPLVGGTIYEMLFNQVRSIAVLPAGAAAPTGQLPATAIEPVGFTAAEDLLPCPAHVHRGYRLIQEYFVFPEKFLYFDLAGLPGLGDGTEAELLFLLTGTPRRRLPLDAGTFRLNCAPIVNLFPKTTEPIRLDHSRVEYRLVPDSHWERSTEIHSILKVSGSSTLDDDSRDFQPYFSFDHHVAAGSAPAFWTARRQPTGRADLPGTDLMLSFVDLNFDPARPAAQAVFAHTLCTNRGLAEQMPVGARLEIEVDAPVRGIACLTRPTRQFTPPLGGATLWRLVSHLSLNHLSLSDDPAALTAFREILRLYAFVDDAGVARQVAGIVGLRARPAVRRVGSDAWRGFCRGTEVTLELDEDQFVGSNPFLLATVLNHFLGLYAAINSFSQLVITSRQRDGIWKTWPPRAGDRAVL